jgi:dipeptidyl aminopeptidase/acylaminoacyl peptidase
VHADGTNARRLTTDPAQDTDPSWTPDGTGVVFSSDRDSRGDLYLLTVATGATVRLTRHFVGRAIMPSVSPAPSRTAFAAQTLRVGAFWDFLVHVRYERRHRARALTAAPAGRAGPRRPPPAHVRLAPTRLDAERDGATLQSTKVLDRAGPVDTIPPGRPT